MATEQPNVLLVMVDDVGWLDVGAYRRGIMGAATPNMAQPIDTGTSHLGLRCIIRA
jgi:arylsulfatase A-like enzyme